MTRSDWQVRTLTDVADVRLGRQRSPRNHHGDHMRPYLRAANIGWSGLLLDDVKSMNFTDVELGTYRLEPGDVLLSEASGSPREVGKPALWSGEIQDCAFQNTLLRVRPREHEPRFLLHYFRHLALAGAFVPEARGVGINHLGRARLAEWRVPVPRISEQRKIVEVLEDHLSRLEAGGGYLGDAKARTRPLELSWLAKARSEAEAQGVVTSIGSVADTALGKMLDAKRQVGVATPYLRNINVRWGEFRLGDVQTTPMTEDDLRRFVVAPGDILACEGGEPGRCAVWPKGAQRMAFQKALHRIRVRDVASLDPSFLVLMLTEAIKSRRYDQLFTGTTIKHLPQEKLRMIQVPVPSVELQLSLAARHVEFLDDRRRLGSQLDELNWRSLALRSALLAAAFSGRLTGRPTDVEVIEELAQ